MIDFDTIANEIIYTDKFQSLKNEPHHGLTRYDHILRVAKKTYKITKKFNLDYISATRGALLHDYFNDSDYRTTKKMKEKYEIHPVIALNNARREFELNNMEENIIISHMYPMCDVKPHYKESWVVTAVDKTVALYECGLYKWRESLALWMIFIFNFLNH